MILAPSILSADFGRLAEQVCLAERGGAGAVHVDVMDGHFVPNITVGAPIVKAVRNATQLPIDVHLMIEHADRYLDAFVDAGASWISLHVEALPHLQRAVSYVRSRGMKAGVALNPATPLTALQEILPELDYVLVMSVNPGFGGQKFIPTALPKIRQVRAMLGPRDVEVSVDGGVGVGQARALVEHGASTLVAGSAIFGAPDPALAVTQMRSAAEARG